MLMITSKLNPAFQRILNAGGTEFKIKPYETGVGFAKGYHLICSGNKLQRDVTILDNGSLRVDTFEGGDLASRVCYNPEGEPEIVDQFRKLRGHMFPEWRNRTEFKGDGTTVAYDCTNNPELQASLMADTIKRGFI